MATFLEEKKASLPVAAKKAAEDIEIASIVKARGFDKGNYAFYPNPNVQRRDGSIINGSVKGSFTITDREEDVILDREELGLNEKSWKKICTAFGYKYHNPTDIDRFVISPKSVKVEISLITPTSED